MARIVSQTINLQDSKITKYITKINDNGITVHPEMTTTNSNYIHIDGNNLMVKKQAGAATAIDTDTILARFGGQGAQIGETSSYNTRLYSNLFGVYQHNDRIFTISADDEKVEIYAGTSTFNTTSTNGYSESFVQALVWHLQNKFYVGENNINIYEEVTDEDTGLTLETPLLSDTYQVIKVLGINGAPIGSTDSMSGDTKYIYCLGSEDNYSFILSEKTAEKLLQRHEFFETYNYILNQCYIGADEKTIYDSSTHLATNYSLTRTLTEERSHTYTDDTEIRNCVMNTSTNTEVWTDDYVNVEYNNHDIQYHIYRLFIECTGTLDNYSFSVNSRYWFTEWAVSSDAKYAGIGSYEVHTIDPDSGQPVDVIEYDNGSVVECTVGGVKTTYSNGKITMSGSTLSNGIMMDSEGSIMTLGMAGMVQMYAGTTPPTGWLLCNGQAVSRTTYAELFAVIGTTYGTGDGSTTFNLPDFRNRMPIGTGDLYNLNSYGGNKDAIIPYHNHGFTNPSVSGTDANISITGGSHTHPVYYRSDNAVGGSSDRLGVQSTHTGTRAAAATATTHTHTLPAHKHTLTGGSVGYAGTSGNTVNANLPPYRGIHFIIATGKTS